MKIKILSLLIVPLIFTGCASILDGGSKSVHLNSNPAGAKVTISNDEGKIVLVQTTPAIVNLARSSGYFRGEDYRLIFEAPGYSPYETRITSEIDGWYFGNILFGGLIGMLAVDPLTGDMYTLSPREINCSLTPSNLPAASAEMKAVETNSPAELKPPAASKGNE